MLHPMRVSEIANERCSIAKPVSLLGDRWTLMVLRQAFLGHCRFEDFHASLGCSRSVLADRLRLLTEEGIFEKVSYKDTVRTRAEYRLTEKGLDLYPVLMALRTWGDQYMAPEGPPVGYRHRGCGGAAVVTHHCERCHEPLSARDVEVRRLRPRSATASA